MVARTIDLDGLALEGAEEPLRVIRAALAQARPGSTLPRVIASETRAAPEEGLALLSAFLSIAEPRTRQALLDIVSALAAER